MNNKNKNNHIYDQSLIDDLSKYAEKLKPINIKAQRIYNRCMRVGKLKIAAKIKLKYRLYENHDDCVTAFGLALMAHKQK